MQKCFTRDAVGPPIGLVGKRALVCLRILHSHPTQRCPASYESKFTYIQKVQHNTSSSAAADSENLRASRQVNVIFISRSVSQTTFVNVLENNRSSVFALKFLLLHHHASSAM